MIDLRIFFAVLVVGLTLLATLQTAPDADPFAPEGGALRNALDRLPPEDVAELKFRHARALPRFDVGVFGNSRSIQIGADVLAVDPSSFFNFSVPGTSIRQSVLLLERLEEIGKLPRVAIVSFDNAALEFYSNPVYPPPPDRWLVGAWEVWHGLTDPGIDLGSAARMARRHAFTEWRAFVGLLSAKHLRARLTAGGNDSAAAKYLPDGSRPRNGLRVARPLTPLQAQAPSVIPGYLAYDLSRLAAIRDKGTMVLVYESPLAPGLAHATSAHAAAVRQQFYAVCAALRLDCLRAPELGDNGHPPFWDNSDHAPGRLLGAWLAGLIADRQAVDRQ